MEQLRLFKIRDLRQKEKFVIDDVYLNGYAKVLGLVATATYMSLCRHADKNQEAFPAEKTIADQHGIKSERTIRRAIKKLKDANIIMIEQTRTSRGKWLNNTYILLDKSQWKQPEDIKVLRESGRTKTTKTVGHQSPIKETHIKETHTMSDKPTDWNLNQKLDEYLKDKRRDLQIIALWIQEMKLNPQNEEQWQTMIKRRLRPAKLLEGYSNEDIIDTIQVMRNTDYLKKIEMETCLKYIEQVVASRRKEGPKIIGFREENRNGKKVMVALYHKEIRD